MPAGLGLVVNVDVSVGVDDGVRGVDVAVDDGVRVGVDVAVDDGVSVGVGVHDAAMAVAATAVCVARVAGDGPHAARARHKTISRNTLRLILDLFLS